MKNTELELTPAQPPAPITPTASLSIEQVFQAVVEKQISPENIAVMRELLAMAAEQKFAAAFVALQSELPTIVATTLIPNRGRYEKFEDVMRQIQPMLSKHGFTVSFSQDFKENRIITTCHLKHGTHTESNSFAVRSGKADTDTQADCKASTTAKRNALLQALNIVIRQDCLTDEDDAALEGGTITPEQAFELERRVALTESNREAFLKFAGAASYAEIAASKYPILDEFLTKKERRGR